MDATADEPPVDDPTEDCDALLVARALARRYDADMARRWAESDRLARLVARMLADVPAGPDGLGD